MSNRDAQAQAIPIDRRGKRRAAVMFTASISCAGASRVIKIRNLSDGGGCIEGEPLVEGMRLVLERNGESTPGRVAWVRENRCGLEFFGTVKVETALRDVARPRRRVAPASRRPGLRCKPLSRAETTAMERWAVLGPQAVGD